jgi:predicted nucleic acid-binding protein
MATRPVPGNVDPQRAAAATHALTRLDVIGADAELVLAAIDTSRSAQLSIWDALIIETARRAACVRVLSGDLADGQTIRGVRIENPFRGSG